MSSTNPFGLDFLPEPVGPSTVDQWEHYADLDGKGLRPIQLQRLTSVNRALGIQISFGQSPLITSKRDYSQWWRRGGGGNANAQYAVSPDRQIFIGMAEQERPFISRTGLTLNLQRGYQRLDDNTSKALARLQRHESGRADLPAPTPLAGPGVNMDSSWFDSEPGVTGLINFSSSPVPWELLVPVPGHDDRYRLRRPDGLSAEQLRQAIFETIFVPLDPRVQFRSQDAPTIIGAAKLMERTLHLK